MCLKWSSLQRMLQNQLYSLTIVYPPSIQPIFTEHLPCIRHCTGHGGCNKRLRPSLGKFTVYQGKQLFIEREHNTPVGENPQDSSVRHRSSQNLSEKKTSCQHSNNKRRKGGSEAEPFLHSVSSAVSKIPGIREPGRAYSLSTMYHTHCHLCLSWSSKPFWEEEINKCAWGHAANSHQSWNPNPDLCPTEAGPQPRTAWHQGSLQTTTLLARETPQVDTVWVTVYNKAGSDVFIIQTLLIQNDRSYTIWLGKVLLYLYKTNSRFKNFFKRH